MLTYQSGPLSFSRTLSHLAYGLFAVLLPVEALAQDDDVIPPTVQMTGGVSQTATIPFVIAWCDNTVLDGSTVDITVNGVTVNSYFTYAGATGSCADNRTSTATAMPLTSGTNVIVASIRDHAGNLGSSSVTYVYGSGFVDVVPDGVTITRAQNGTFADQFLVHNLGNLTTTFRLAATCLNGASSCSVADTVRLLPDSTATVTVSYQTGDKATYTTGTVRLRARVFADSTAADSGSVTVSLASSLLIDTSINNYDAQSMSMCAFSCFANIFAVPTVGYSSLGGDRGLILVSNSTRVRSRPYVMLDVALRPGPATVTELKVAVRDSATGNPVKVMGADNNQLGEIHYSLTGAANGAFVRIATVINDDSLLRNHGTSVRTLRLILSTVRAAYTETDTTYLPILVVQDVPGAVTRGWYVAGLQRLLKLTSGRRLVVEADGSAFLFVQPDDSGRYVSPNGEFSQLRRYGPEETGTYIRAYADSSKVHFDSLGRMVSATDAWGVKIRYAYDAYDRPIRIYDPYRTRPDSTAAPSAYTEIAYGSGVAYIRPPNPDGSSYDASRVTTLRFNSDSSLRAVIDPDGDSTRFTYRNSYPFPDNNRSGQLKDVYDRNGVLSVTFSYDESAPTTGSKSLTTIARATVALASGISGATVNSQPTESLIDWRSDGVPTSPTSSSSLKPAPKVDAAGGRVMIAGQPTYTRHDRWGQILETISPGYLADAGQSPYFSVDTTRVFRTGLMPDSIRYPSGATDRFRYMFGFGRQLLAWSRNEGQDSVSYSYDPFGQLWTITTASAPTQAFHRSIHAAHLDSITTGGLATRIRYDVFGRDTSITDPGNHVTRKTYDLRLGNLNRIETPGGRYSQVTFDGHGRDSILTDNTGAERHVRYDGIDRVTRDSLGGEGSATVYGYDKEFALSVTDPKGQIFRRAVNVLGWTTKVYDAADTTKVTTYRYNARGQVASWTNRRGHRTEIEYDALGRPLGSTNTGGFAADSFAYGFRYSTYPKTLNVTPRSGQFMVYRNGYATDSIWSDLTGFVDSVVTRVIDRRPFGLNNAFAQKRFVRRYSKNADKQLANIAVDVRAAGSGTVLTTLTPRGFGYDNDTRALSSLTVGPTTVTLDRDNERKPELWTFPHFQRAIQYTPRHESANSYYSVPGLQGLFGRSYAFQTSSGRLTQMSRAWAGDTVLVRTLGYTPRGQLKQLADSLIASPTCTNTGGTLTDGVVCTGGAVALKSLTFQYDSAGNQTRQIDNLGGADSLNATYVAANRLNGIAGVTYTYDDDGNVATRTTASGTVYFTYDASSHLVTVRAGADTTFYGYNALGQLVTRSRNDNSGTNKRNLERVFFWDGDHLMAEMDSTLVTRVGEWAYYPGIDSPLGVVTSTSGGGTKLRFYHQDEIGNVIGLTDSSAIVQALEYGPWGDVVASTGGAVADTSRLQWKGLIWEDGKTQLYYVRNRWYDPVARRFITEDPIGIEGGINLYNFGASDPVNNFDPFGQACRRHTGWAKDIVNEVVVGIRILWDFIECDSAPDGPSGARDRGPGSAEETKPPTCGALWRTSLTDLAIDVGTFGIGRWVMGLRAAADASKVRTVLLVRPSTGSVEILEHARNAGRYLNRQRQALAWETRFSIGTAAATAKGILDDPSQLTAVKAFASVLLTPVGGALVSASLNGVNLVRNGCL